MTAMLESSVSRVPSTPKFLELEITRYCQMTCSSHCYAKAGPTQGHGTMSSDEWKRIWPAVEGMCTVVVGAVADRGETEGATSSPSTARRPGRCRQVPAAGQRDHLVRIHFGNLGLPPDTDQQACPREVTVPPRPSPLTDAAEGGLRASVSRSAAHSAPTGPRSAARTTSASPGATAAHDHRPLPASVRQRNQAGLGRPPPGRRRHPQSTHSLALVVHLTPPAHHETHPNHTSAGSDGRHGPDGQTGSGHCKA